ncbi:MAG TPA: hypothetical protein VN783_10980 [Thermoanaerobaculia bacterium]|nr:hypothetical protein [Thermoanaerobaculia bacterium]
MKNLLLATTAALVLAVTAGCGRSEAPVARLKVEPNALRLPYPELAALKFTWEPISAVPTIPTVFVHLVDEKGEIERTFDHPYPAAFQPGSPQTYNVHIYQTALATPLPAGKHRLVAGLYLPGGDRWTLEAGGEEFRKREYVVATIDVPPVDPQAPKLAFTRTWLAAEGGGDRQTLIRRWLTGNGALRLAPIKKTGAFFLSFRIPQGDNPGEKLVTEGPNPPSVEIASSCGGVLTNISGPGSHLVQIPVDALPADGQCVVRLHPNYHLEVTGSPFKRTVALENVAWAPKAAS